MTTATATPEEQEQFAVSTGLRVAAATSICIVVTESFHLDYAYMSALSAHIVMAQYEFTSFQKGVERVLGRGIGLAYGTVLVLLFSQHSLLFLTLLVAGQLVAFYIYASGRLAYTAMMAGVFFHMVAYLGVTANPSAALPTATSIMIQVLLGVGAAWLVNWTTGAERSLIIETGSEPLLPLRPEWMSRSCMLAVTATLTMFVGVALDLPVIPAVVSALLLAMTTDPHALTIKARQRILGVVFGGGYSLAALLLLNRLPQLVLLIMLAALGMFLAAYTARASTRFSYVGLQSGMVATMVMIGPTDEFGTMQPALQRLIGVVVGLAISLGVHFLWDRGANPALPPAP